MLHALMSKEISKNAFFFFFPFNFKLQCQIVHSVMKLGYILSLAASAEFSSKTEVTEKFGNVIKC